MRLSFFPALREPTEFVQWYWLTWCELHWSHPEDCLCWANANACSVRDASFWVEDKCLTSLPAFYWFHSKYVRAQCRTNLDTKSTANTCLFIYVRNYSYWHLITDSKLPSEIFKHSANCITLFYDKIILMIKTKMKKLLACTATYFFIILTTSISPFLIHDDRSSCEGIMLCFPLVL